MLRCKKGAYDNSTLAGLKTAAFSPSFKNYPAAFQREAENNILQSVLPDTVETSSGQNRGILRLINVGDCMIVSRIFRVRDLCDYRGKSSFVHSYLIDGEDRNTLLSRPACLSSLNCFDSYQNVNTRCGGLDSTNPIPIDDGLKMPDFEAAFPDKDIFTACQMTQNEFSCMISAVCRVLSGKGYLSLLLSDVTETTWQEEGGSLKGEELLLSVMKVLPDCLSRFFSGISYWNENNNYYGLEKIKIRVCTGRFLSDLQKRSDVHILYIGRPEHSSPLKPCRFGDYLWTLYHDEAALHQFHAYIRKVFGEKVDAIAKPPRLMDAVTEMYLHQNPSDEGIQSVIAEFIELFGSSIGHFPVIVQYCDEGIRYLRENRIPLEDRLEKVIVSAKKLSYEMLACLVQQIIEGTASDAVLEKVKGLILRRRLPAAEQLLSEQIRKICQDGMDTITETMFRLVIAYYAGISDENEQTAALRPVLTEAASRYFWKGTYDHYLMLLNSLLSTPKTFLAFRDVRTLLEWYTEHFTHMIYLFGIQSRYATAVGKILAGHFELLRKNKQYSALLKTFFQSFFLQTSVDLTVLFENENIFRVFILLALCLSDQYLQKWKDCYRQVLLRNYEAYSEPDVFFSQESDELICKGLFQVESVRLSVRPLSSWQRISAIIERDSQKDRRYKVISYVLRHAQNSEEILRDMAKTSLIYHYILYCVEELNHADEDNMNMYAALVIDQENVFDSLIKAAREDTRRNDVVAKVYAFFWARKNPRGRISDEETVQSVYAEEKRLEGCEYLKSVMKKFGVLFMRDIFPYGTLPPSSVRLLNHGIRCYEWGDIRRSPKSVTDLLKLREIIDKLLVQSSIDADDNPDSSWKFLFRSDQDKNIRELIPYIKERLDAQIQNDAEPVTDGYAILGIACVFFSASRKYSDEGLAWRYLSYVHSGSKKDGTHWRSAEYLMTGLKYLCMIGRFNALYSSKIDNFKTSCVCIFVDNLLKSDGKKYVLSCKGVYDQYVRDNLSPQLRKNLGDKAADTRDEELKEMFPRENIPDFPAERPRKNKKNRP